MQQTIPTKIKNLKKGDTAKWYNWRDDTDNNTATIVTEPEWSTDWDSDGEWVMLVLMNDDSGPTAPANGEYWLSWGDGSVEDGKPNAWNLGDV